jgi:3-(3-hydroxy-phenyl)propionate hydroxylase
MPVSNHLPVLVVGAGPTGLVAANLLATYGVATVLVEAKPTVNRKPRATFLDDEFFRLIETVGLGDAIRRQVLGPTTYERYSPLGFLLSREEGVITTHNYPTRSAIYQPWFDQALLDGLARFAHVETLFEHELVGFEQDADKVTVTLRRGDHSHTRTFSYLLGADGSRSTVRELLKVNFDAVSPHESRTLRIDVEGDPDTALVMRGHGGFERSYSSFPAPNGRRFGFSLRDGEDPEKMMTDEALQALFKKHLGYDKVRIINRAHYTFRSRLAARFRVGRAFLLGDAAHTQPPAGSQGMNSGARDANALAWKVAAVLRGDADAGLLDLYETERLEPMRATVATASRGYRRIAERGALKTVFADLWTKLKSLRDLGEQPWRRQGGSSHVTTGRVTRVTAGLIFGTPREAADDILGRVLPNPWVEVDARGVLLDNLLGTGFALVAIEPAQPSPSGLQHPLWKRLGARVVHLTRHEPGPAGAARVSDHRLDEFWRANAGLWLFVRPDRIVAASVEPDGLGRLGDDLDTILCGRTRLALAA